MKATLDGNDIPPDAIIFWVIYDHPKDHPGKYVLRPQFAVRADDVGDPEDYGTVVERVGRGITIAARKAWYADTLEEARAMVPDGCHKFTDPNPVVAEVWMQ